MSHVSWNNSGSESEPQQPPLSHPEAAMIKTIPISYKPAALGPAHLLSADMVIHC